MSQLIHDLLQSVKNDAPVRNVLIGAHWTAVSSRLCGMASTVMKPQPHGEEVVRDAGSLHLKSAGELSQYLLSENYLEAGIGLAALNSLSEIPEKNITEINAFKVVGQIGAGKHVAVFGHFPYLEEIKASAARLSVFEIFPTGEELSLERVPEVLPGADVVALTSNAVINHTIDSILPYIQKSAFAMLVGPSTPLNPLLFEAGFSLLAGVRIIDEQVLFQSIGQAAIFRQVKGAQVITVSKEPLKM